jgi:hypothetical protein
MIEMQLSTEVTDYAYEGDDGYDGDDEEMTDDQIMTLKLLEASMAAGVKGYLIAAPMIGMGA